MKMSMSLLPFDCLGFTAEMCIDAWPGEGLTGLGDEAESRKDP